MRTAPEMSRKIQINGLRRLDDGRGQRDREIVVEANDDERVALAHRLAIPGIAALKCRFRLGEVDDDGRVPADGLLTATLRRVCVASLEEFDGEVVEAFRVRFVPEQAGTDGTNEELDPESDDDIPYEGTQIDLGEATVEQLALAMEPYPRKPGVELPPDIGSVDVPDPLGEDGADVERPNPFAVLAARKDN